MHSDTESLAFMEESDASPPPAEIPRPRITAGPRSQLPSPTQIKPTPSKPPLHTSVAPTPVKQGGLTHPTPAAALGGKGKAAVPHDAAADFSDNDSIMFSVDNASLAASPMHDGAASHAQIAAAAVLRGHPQRRFSRAASNSSIHFSSEPGSRNTSPSRRLQPGPQGLMTPAEKTRGPVSPPPQTTKASVTNDSISFFVDHSDGSEHLGEASPKPQSATARGPPVRLVPATAAGASVLSNDSIAFQVEDVGDAKGHVGTSPAAPPLARPAAATNATTSKVAVAAEPRATPPAAVADTSHTEFMDNGSIAFEVMDDHPPVAASSPAAAAAKGHKKATPSPPKRPSAVPYYNSHAHRSQSLQSRLDSRPNSPSIQFESAHNSDAETVLDHSASQLGEGSPPMGSVRLPQFSHVNSPPALPMPTVLADASLVENEGGWNGSERGTHRTSSSTTNKKTVVTNHLQRRQQQQQQQQPAKPPRSPARTAAGSAPRNARSTSPSTHPPLYQKSAVSTPIAAQAAGAAASDSDARHNRRSASLSDRNLPKRKKDPAAVLSLQQPRRSRESAATESQGASPNTKVYTEAGSTGSTDSPPEPLHTGRHSRTSTDVHFSVGQGDSPSQSVRGYLEDQEVENRYHRLAGQSRQTDRVLYREVSPSQDRMDLVAAVPGGLDGGQHAAAQEAEQWRRFNDQQRRELAELRRRIALARRQDCTLLENSTAAGLGGGPSSRRGGSPQPSPHGLSQLPGWPQSGQRYSVMKARTGPLMEAQHQQQQLVEMRGRGASATVKEVQRHSPTAGAGGYASSHLRGQTMAATKQAQQQQQLLSNRSALQNNPMRAPVVSGRAAPPALSPKAVSYAAPLSAPLADMTTPSHHDLIHSSAAARVADMLGVQWPPRTPARSSASRTNRTLTFPDNALSTDLYFVNGSRLTAAQVDRFVDLVHVQAEAEEQKPSGKNGVTHPSDMSLSYPLHRHADPLTLNAGDASSTSASPSPGRLTEERRRQRPPLSAKLTALLPRKAVRRSRVMREVFTVMDLKREGTLHVDFMPSLARLFESELGALEQARTSLLEGKATPLATLLESAQESRAQYAAAWAGGRTRSSGDSGRAGGLSHVLAADSVGLTVEAQAELLSLTHRLLLLSFAVNVVIPVASASRIPLLDFATLCMILYAAVDNAEHAMDSPQEQWREVVQQYFVLLDS